MTDVTYPGGDYELDVNWPSVEDALDRDSDVLEAVGKERSSSGFGFGYRDMQFTFEASADADAACKRVEALGIEGLNAQVSANQPSCEHLEEVLDFVLDFEHRTPAKLKVELRCNICGITGAIVNAKGMARHDERAVRLAKAVWDAVKGAFQ